jgi:virulence factor Mce-like protein
MSRARRPRASIVASPVLVGAVTTLVVVVAVFLAYNANNGLPFVPTRQLNVLVSNGGNLIKGNEVRSGGFRVGVVTDMTPVMLPAGKVGAKVTLKLDRKFGPVPVDSHIVIRPRSALGLKYVELDAGRSKKVFADGATMPAGQAKVPVELDEVFNMFDAPTRRASQGNLRGFGDALAGRGTDLNQTIQVAPELFDHLRSVMTNLSDRRTHLRSFFKELDDTARVVAPVSQINAHRFTTMADTFGALSRDPRALKAVISKSPPTLRAGTESLRVQRPFLEHIAALSRDLDAAATELRGALPTVDSALRVGTPVMRRSTALNDNLQGALGALDDLVKAPTTLGSLRALTATVGTLQPQLRFLGPYLTVCNYWNIFWTFAAEHLSAPDDTGSSQRALLNMGGQQPGSDGIAASGANEFAHGEGALPGNADQWVHNNVYGPAIGPDGQADCGAGQTGYIQAYNPLRDKSVKGDPYQGAVTERFPLGPPARDLGPTYARFDRNGKGVGLNPDHVPAGETFTDRPGGHGADIARGEP